MHQAWCNPRLPVEQRVSDMIRRMTTDERLSYLAIRSPPAPSLGLPAYNWWEEATHGVTACAGEGHVGPPGSCGNNTNVAFPITTAMSFNRSLW